MMKLSQPFLFNTQTSRELFAHNKSSLAPFCSDFAQKLAAALAHNPSSGLTTINLANNPLEDRGTIPALIYSNVLLSVLLWAPLCPMSLL